MLLAARHPGARPQGRRPVGPAPVARDHAAARARDVARVVRAPARRGPARAQRRGSPAWFIRREGVPAEDVEIYVERLREPARASATTRLYRAYLRTLATTARGRAPEPRTSVPTLLMIGARDMAVTPKLAAGHRARRRRPALRADPRRGPLRVRHARPRRGRAAALVPLNGALHALSGGRSTPKVFACDAVSSRESCSRCWPGRRRGMLRVVALRRPLRPAAPATAAPVPSLIASRFAVTPRTLQPGAPASFRYRIDGSRQSLRVRVELLPVGSRRPAARIRMGWKRAGPHARAHLDAAGRRARRPATTSRACTPSTAAAARCAAPPPPPAARA